MRIRKFAPFCALILTLGVLLLTAGTAHAQVSMLAQVCGFLNGKTTGLTPTTIATLKNAVMPKNKPTEDNCLTARPLFKVGGITAFYQDKEGRYIFMLQHAQDISAVVFSETGVPEVQFNQTEVTMADGIKLPTFIVRSKKTVNKPGLTILTRSPYMNSKLWWVVDAVTLARQEYQVVQQPARGTFTAPGELEWMNWRQERSDAQSTLDWISAQTWSNRQIAVKGNSYDGFLALAAATTFHPNLVAVIASSAPWNAKVDSVSGRADVLDVAAYVATLNGSGSSYAPAHTLMGKLADKVPSIPGFIKAIQATFKLKFNGIPLDGKFPDNRDFAAEIKKSKAAMLYSYGLHDDQDSRDILNLAKIIQGTPHHYFMGQPLGHDIGMALMLFRKVKVAGAQAAQDFSDGFKKEFGGYSSCAYVDPEGTEKYCENEIAKIFPIKPLQLPLQNLQLKGQQGVTWDFDKEGLMMGQAKLRFKVTIPALPTRMRLMYAPFYCTKEKCQYITAGAPGGEPLSEGVQVIEFETNHIMQTFEVGAKIGIQFRAIDAKSEVIPIPIELNHIQFILPVQE